MSNLVRRKAKWWQFWFPQSGFEGGIILGCLIAGLFYLYIYFTGL